MTPDRHTNQELFLEVGDGHEVYIQDWGNKEAKHVIFHLHGGPGGGSKDKYKLQYDPARQRVIFHDQRGSGRSLPLGSLENNTTEDLVEDISRIADKLDIKTFILTGGSWGATLALAYGIAHPERVEAMVIDGVFTGSQQEIEWIDQGMFKAFYPDSWQQYLEATPKSHHDNPSEYHYQQVFGDDEEAAKRSAFAYDNLEGGPIKLDDRAVPEKYEDFDPTGTRIEMHYLMNGCFMPDRFIFEHADKLTMPVHIVQGRYDMVCPPVTAYELHHKLANSELTFTISGHLAEHETWSLKRALLLELCK